MSMQSSAAYVPGSIRSRNDSNLFVQATVKKEKKHPLVDFICTLNPVNWFKEFSHIEISMEEFEVKRGQAVSRI